MKSKLLLSCSGCGYLSIIGGDTGTMSSVVCICWSTTQRGVRVSRGAFTSDTGRGIPSDWDKVSQTRRCHLALLTNLTRHEPSSRLQCHPANNTDLRETEGKASHERGICHVGKRFQWLCCVFGLPSPGQRSYTPFLKENVPSWGKPHPLFYWREPALP